MKADLSIIRRLVLTEKNADRRREEAERAERLARAKDSKDKDKEKDESKKRLWRYAFEVDIKANKVEIKKALLEAFNLKPKAVTSLTTLIMPGKPKRRGRMRRGWTSDRKRAVLTTKVEITELQQG
jgi:large subunit ribosomal protein L23